MNGNIFINYRGTDAHSYAVLLYVELSRFFGPDLVFLDSESIPAGADFVEQLLHRVRHARAILAVIGPGWLAATGPRRRPRPREPVDWTRRELIEAFAVGIPVIPVLADNTDLPTERELPASLTQLSRCQYRRLRCRDARADLDRIANDLIASDPELVRAAGPPSLAPVRPPPMPATPDNSRQGAHRAGQARPAAPAATGPAPPPRTAAATRTPDHDSGGQATGVPTNKDPGASLYAALVASRRRVSAAAESLPITARVADAVNDCC